MEIVGLPTLIECHYNNGGAITADQSSLSQKFLFAVLQADGIDDGFALHAFETSFNHAPLRAVDYDRNPRDVRLAAKQIEKTCHGCFRIDHAFVHVHIQQVRAALDLLTRNRERALEIFAENHLRELGRTSDIGSLTNYGEPELWCNL